MKEIETLLRDSGFTIEYTGKQEKNMYSFFAYTDKHCLVVTVFKAFDRDEQCACATFDPSYLTDIKKIYGKFDNPGFDAYTNADEHSEVPTLIGPHNHDHSVSEIASWLKRAYPVDSGKTSTFT